MKTIMLVAVVVVALGSSGQQNVMGNIRRPQPAQTQQAAGGQQNYVPGISEGNRTDKIVRYCNAEINNKADFGSGFCLGYITATVDAHNVQQIVDSQTGANSSRDYCIPGEVTVEELVKVFLLYANQHPEVGHKHMLLVFPEALKNAFPCGGGN